MKRGTPRHPKLAELTERLNLPRYAAVGILELLWHFAAEFAPRGDIGRFSDKRIEAALDWNGATGYLIELLVKTGWIDPSDECRLVIHDWHDHCEDSVRKRNLRANTTFLSLTAKVTGQSQTMSGTHSESVCLPLPLPLPEPQPRPLLAAASRNGHSPPSQRFEEWWTLWSSVRGTAHRTHAERAWFNVATVELENAIMDCTQSYLDSLENPAKGYNPHNFLVQMAQDKFAGHFVPPKKQPPKDEFDNRYTLMK